MKGYAEPTGDGHIAIYLGDMVAYMDPDEAQAMALAIMASKAILDTRREFEIISVDPI